MSNDPFRDYEYLKEPLPASVFFSDPASQRKERDQWDENRKGPKQKNGRSGLEAVHDPWPEPAPLISAGTPEPYPIDAMPEPLRLAVAEAQAFTKAPVPLVAGSALAGLSVSAQHLADVKRAEGLAGPSGLYLLTVADSGERKTTCDGLFLDPIREWETAQTLAAEPKLKEYRGRLAAWEAHHDGLKNRVRMQAKSQKSTREATEALADHEVIRPERPRVPRLLRVDATPEALAWALAHEWPAAGVISSEAGLVFGSHAMGRDSVMRNLSLLNILWDGGSLPISRRTSESFTVRGARLTVALQIQEPTLRAFFEACDGLARGTGFLSRFLVAWPESTQGFRKFTEPPASWPALEAYRRRLVALLETSAPLQADGSLCPVVLSLSPEGKADWVRFHDDVEAELKAEGELADVRDVAAKAGDNVARLACLFHVLEHGPGGLISAEHITAGARIVAWHLTEARRFLAALALPPEQANAVRLDEWLMQHCRETGTGEVSAREVLQFGPNTLRKADTRNRALEVLADAGRVRVDKVGRREQIRVNPVLFSP